MDKWFKYFVIFKYYDNLFYWNIHTYNIYIYTYTYI